MEVVWTQLSFSIHVITLSPANLMSAASWANVDGFQWKMMKNNINFCLFCMIFKNSQATCYWWIKTFFCRIFLVTPRGSSLHQIRWVHTAVKEKVIVLQNIKEVLIALVPSAENNFIGTWYSIASTTQWETT